MCLLNLDLKSHLSMVKTLKISVVFRKFSHKMQNKFLLKPSSWTFTYVNKCWSLPSFLKMNKRQIFPKVLGRVNHITSETKNFAGKGNPADLVTEKPSMCSDYGSSKKQIQDSKLKLLIPSSLLEKHSHRKHVFEDPTTEDDLWTQVMMPESSQEVRPQLGFVLLHPGDV